MKIVYGPTTTEPEISFCSRAEIGWTDKEGRRQSHKFIVAEGRAELKAVKIGDTRIELPDAEAQKA